MKLNFVKNLTLFIVLLLPIFAVLELQDSLKTHGKPAIIENVPMMSDSDESLTYLNDEFTAINPTTSSRQDIKFEPLNTESPRLESRQYTPHEPIDIDGNDAIAHPLYGDILLVSYGRLVFHWKSALSIWLML